MSVPPASRSESTSHAMSGRPPSGNIGFGVVEVMGRSRVPMPAARIMAFIVCRSPFAVRRSVSRLTANGQRPTDSQILRREYHVFRQVAARAPRLTIEIGVGLPDRLVHVHAEVGGDGADDVDGAFDLEVFTDRGAIETALAILAA